jgi:predicted DNA-binding transcriptional regulator AlpA
VLRRLAELPGEALIDADALGTALAVSARTVQRLVGQRHLPPGVELGGRTVWIVGRVLAWLAGRAEQAEKKAARFCRNAP